MLWINWQKKYKATYSRYADDITFSSNKSVFKNPDFLKELEEIIASDGFSINMKKTRLQKKNARQEVTGITVNEKLNTARKYVKQIRMWLYLIEKYGVQKAEGIFRRDYIREKGHIKFQGNPMFNVIEGKLLYLKMVKGEEDGSYQKLAQRFDKVRGFNADEILKAWEEKGINQAKEMFDKAEPNIKQIFWNCKFTINEVFFEETVENSADVNKAKSFSDLEQVNRVKASDFQDDNWMLEDFFD